MDMSYVKKDVLLSINDVHLSFGERVILDGITARIHDIVRPNMSQGQVVGLLGRSGVGKTQLFRILAGLQNQSSGTVLVTDKQVPVKQGMVGMVAQNYPLFDHRTVLGNILIAAAGNLTSAEKLDKAMTLLKRFGLEEKADDYPAELSGGQRQRVAIAQQLICSNHFLLMDEPFTGLDPVMVDEVCNLITEVSEMDELNTIIISSHILSATVMVADTLWLMGQDHDESGKRIPGAKIKDIYDLIEMGLAWRKGISTTPAFADCIAELRQRFFTL